MVRNYSFFQYSKLTTTNRYSLPTKANPLPNSIRKSCTLFISALFSSFGPIVFYSFPHIKQGLFLIVFTFINYQLIVSPRDMKNKFHRIYPKLG